MTKENKMILIVDNNEYRRHDIWLSIFMKKYIVSEQSFYDAECCTKPILTAYINPSLSEIEKIKQEDTICVVAKNNLKLKPPAWMHVVPLDRDTPKRIMEIYDANFDHLKGREVIGIIGIEGDKFTLGGTYINFNKHQLLILKMLIFNPKKTFELWDLLGYSNLQGNREANLMETVTRINRRCRVAHREELVIAKNEKYRINPNVLKY